MALFAVGKKYYAKNKIVFLKTINGKNIGLILIA